MREVPLLPLAFRVRWQGSVLCKLFRKYYCLHYSKDFALQAYESLWDDVMKQVLTQTSPSLLGISISTISYMLSTATLLNTNNAKRLELDDELAASLQEVVAGYTELDAAMFSSDEIDTLTGVLSCNN